MSLNLADEVSVILRKVLYRAIKSYDMEPMALLPCPKEVMLQIFITLKKKTLF
jgi:hypothetical protein